MENSTLALVGVFISVAILVSIGIQMFAGPIQDCSELPGAAYDLDGGSVADAYWPSNSLNSSSTYVPNSSVDWAQQCETGNNQNQNAFTLLFIITVVIAAVAILSVLRTLG